MNNLIEIQTNFKQSLSSNFVSYETSQKVAFITSQCVMISIKEECPNTQQEVPVAFKMQWMDTTSKFVTDDTWTTLKYPEMTTPQADFIHSLFVQGFIDSDQESGILSLYTAFWKGMKIVQLKYNFKVSSVVGTKPNISCLLVEKIINNGNFTKRECIGPNTIQHTQINQPKIISNKCFDTPNKNRIITISTAYMNNIRKYMLVPFGPECLSIKKGRNKTFGYTVLLQILMFVKNNETSREVVFEYNLTQKQYNYVKRMVNRVNAKRCWCGLQFESDLLEEIKHFTGNNYLNVLKNRSRMSFILEKQPYTNPFVYLSPNAPNLGNQNIDFDNIIANVNNCEDDELAIIENDSSPIIISDCESVNEEPIMDDKTHLDFVNLEYKDKSNYMVVNSEMDNFKIKRADFETVIKKPRLSEIVKMSLKRKHCKSESEGENENSSKKIKLLTKNVCLVPKDYPNKTADAEFAILSQRLISKRLDDSKVLPFLKCHGVKNGALMYSCHTEKSFLWLESICAASDIKVIDSKEICVAITTYKLAIKVNTYIDESYTRLFNRLELYNEGLHTSEWVIVKKENYSDFIVVVVKVDQKSFNYVKAAGFSLFAGVDEAMFCLIWD